MLTNEVLSAIVIAENAANTMSNLVFLNSKYVRIPIIDKNKPKITLTT